MANKALCGIEYLRFCGSEGENPEGKCTHQYEILYISDREARMKIEGSEILLDEGSICIVKPLSFYEICSESRPFECHLLSFSSGDLSSAMLDLLNALLSADHSFTCVCGFDVAEMARILAGISFSDKLSGEARQQYLSAIVSQILILASSAENKKASLGADEFARGIIDFISESININKFPSLDDIAKTFFVSKFYLCRVFKNYCGISIHAYINRKRMMLAKQYISSGMSARDVSRLVGYTDYSAFYRAYVKATGKSPKSPKGE